MRRRRVRRHSGTRPRRSRPPASAIGARQRAAGVAALAPVWPLPQWKKSKVQTYGRGTARGFGADRGDHRHAGVDLGPPKAGELGRAAGSTVVSPFVGVVTRIGGWRTGTRRVEISTPVGRIVLGALDPNLAVKVGSVVLPGQKVGVLGLYPGGSAMLHLEWWIGPRGRWLPGKPRPVRLRNPTLLMRMAV